MRENNDRDWSEGFLYNGSAFGNLHINIPFEKFSSYFSKLIMAAQTDAHVHLAPKLVLFTC